jgi:hypothetical protein
MTTNVGGDVGEKEPLYTVGEESKLVQLLWKSVERLLKNLK